MLKRYAYCGPRVASAPTSTLDRTQKLLHLPIKHCWLFKIDSMSGPRLDKQSCCRNGTFQKDTGLKAGVVFISNNNQGRNRQRTKLLSKIVEGRPFPLIVLHRQRRSLSRMLTEMVRKFLPSAWVFDQQLHSGWTNTHFLRHCCRSCRHKLLGIDLALLQKFLTLVLHGSATAARRHKCTCHLRMPEAKHQRCIRSLAQPDDMGFGHPSMSYDCSDVVGKVSVVVRSVILGDIRRWIATGSEGNAAIVAREIAHLGFPLSMICGELMHENDGVPGSGFFNIELHSICVSVRHACLLMISNAL